MNRDELVEVLKAQAAFNLIPESLQKDLRLTDDFHARAMLVQTWVISFGADGPRVDSQALLEGIRALYEGQARKRLLDLADQRWTLTLVPDRLRAKLQREKQRFYFALAYTLSPDPSIRLAGLVADAKVAEFTDSELEVWGEQLGSKPLPPTMLSDLEKALSLAPGRVALKIAANTAQPNFSLPDLVPGDKQYYFRLLAPPDGAPDIAAYLETVARTHLAKLSAGRSEQIMERGLLYSAHSAGALALRAIVSDAAKMPVLPPDPFSQVGYLEYLSATATERSLEVVDLARELWTKFEASLADFALIGALFILVEAELARCGTLEDVPPYWRRLAALAHAAVVFRAMPLPLRADGRFADFVLAQAEFTFSLTTMLDLRVEPRWLPIYAAADQLQAELLGRVLGALATSADRAGPHQELVRQEREAALAELVDSPKLLSMFFPGPCEGGITPEAHLSDDLRNELEAGLKQNPPKLEALTLLFAHSRVFQLTPETTTMAVDALRRMMVDAHDPTSMEPLSPLIPQLAVVAAVGRDAELADQVRILCRIARRHDPPQITPSIEFQACLGAAAAHRDFESYGRLLGDWLEELCRGVMSVDEAYQLMACLDFLVYRAPRLWPMLAPALNLAKARYQQG